MNRLQVLEIFDRASAVRRRLGLPSTRLGQALLQSWFRGDMEVTADGLSITGSAPHRPLLYGAQAGTREPFTRELFENAIKPGMVVLDLGANLGYYTLLAARAGATVIAVEPDPRSYAYLVRNVQRNGFAGQVMLVRKAVSDRAGSVSFGLHIGPESSSLFAAPEESESIEVDAVAIDELLPEEVVVDVIKMDIEGAEIHALRGMERTIARAGDGLTLLLEANPAGLRAAGSSVEALIAKLCSMGLAVSVVDEERRQLCSVDTLDPENPRDGHGITNLHCVRAR